MMRFITKNKVRLLRAGAVLLTLAVWQAAAWLMGEEILLPAPAAVLRRLAALVLEADFWRTVLFSFARITAGFLLAFLAGVLLGFAAGRVPVLEHLLWPLFSLVKSVPVASFIVISLIWLSAANISVFISFLMVLPIVYTNVLNGMKSAPPALLEMTSLFGVSSPGGCCWSIFPPCGPTSCRAAASPSGWRGRRASPRKSSASPTAPSAKNFTSPRCTSPPATCSRGRRRSCSSAFCSKSCSCSCSAGFTRVCAGCKRQSPQTMPPKLAERKLSPSAEAAVAFMDVTTENLSVSFGEKQVLRALSLTFPAGSCTAVMGPSGCGKTTLLRVLMGLEKTYTGCVSGVPEKRSAVFQEDRLQDFYSALMNLRLTLPGVKSDALLRELALLGLTEDDARKPAQSLSGGMKRRVALARAMLADSDIVFLDEPFKGLDETTRARAVEYVRSRRNGRTLIAVTHDEREALALGCTILRPDFAASAVSMQQNG